MMIVEIWGKPACGFCNMAKTYCEKNKLQYVYKELDKDFTREQVFETFPGAKTFPQIKIGNTNVGSYNDFIEYIDSTGFNGTGHTLG